MSESVRPRSTSRRAIAKSLPVRETHDALRGLSTRRDNRTPPTNEELLATVDRMTQSYDRWMRLRLGQGANGVTEARLKLLFILEANGPQKMSALAKSARIAARTLTTLVDALEREGLARRVPHSSDRRATLIELTDAGAAIADEAAGPYWSAKGFLFDSLSTDERLILMDIYERWAVKVEEDLRAMDLMATS